MSTQVISLEVRTPIVLSDGTNKFQYLVRSIEDDTIKVANTFKVIDSSGMGFGNTRIISKTMDPLVRQTNFWKTIEFSSCVDEAELPETIHKRTIQIDVPDFNPTVYADRYEQMEFVVDVTTKIGLMTVVLACERFKSDDLLSIPDPYNDGHHKYHQYFTIEVLDPWDLCYSDEYREFREYICEEIPNTNNCGAILDISISVATNGEDGSLIQDIRYSSGRNLILLSERDTDYMGLSLTDCPEGWNLSLEFNEAYDGNLREYLRETYLMDNVGEIVPEIVIMDRDHIYKMLDIEYGDKTDWIFSSSDTNLRFSDWGEYIDGLFAMATLRISDTSGNEIMDLKSNIVPVGKRKFSFIVGDEITLEDMDITVENLDVVNKIQKNIVKVNRPDDYKSNIIRPVFYRAYPLDEIDIHSSVTFTISIDLDSYKTKSDSFSIQIEGKNFPEIGRVPGGVLFKINGQELPHTQENGKYYILDTNQELVSEGNYRYV